LFNEFKRLSTKPKTLKFAKVFEISRYARNDTVFPVWWGGKSAKPTFLPY